MALTFNGLNYLKKTSALVASPPLTLTCWFKPSSVAADGRIMGITSDTSTHHSEFSIQFLTSDKKARAYVANDAGSTTDATAAASTVMSAGNWYHICAIFTSATSRACYVNGANSGSSVVSVTPGTCDTTTVGAVLVNAAVVAGAVGDIAYPAVYNIALTASDASALGAARLSPQRKRASALVGYAHLIGTSPEPDLVSATGWTVVIG